MYHIKLRDTKRHKIDAEYTIPGDLVIIRRHSCIDGEWEDFNVGVSVDVLLTLAEIIKERKEQHAIGIDPPDNEVMVRKHDSYMDEM